MGNMSTHRYLSTLAYVQVLEFRRDYLQRCPDRQKTLSAVLSSGRITSPGVGLGSNINFALTMFVLANQSIVPRNFRLYVKKWNYGPWEAFFRDFAADSTCPIVEEVVEENVWKRVNETSSIFQLDADLVTPDCMIGTGTEDRLIREINSYPWVQFFDSLYFVGQKMGVPEIFRMKSLIARAFLDLQPELRSIVEKIWSRLVQQ